MIEAITHFIEGKCRMKTKEPVVGSAPKARPQFEAQERQQQSGFTKVFRWPVPPGQTPQPTTVEVAGSFTDWQRVPLAYDQAMKTWQVFMHNIGGNHTHHYVMLVDGKPSYDKTCDGLAVPQSPDEAKWPIETPKGPRIMLLFAETK